MPAGMRGLLRCRGDPRPGAVPEIPPAAGFQPQPPLGGDLVAVPPHRGGTAEKELWGDAVAEQGGSPRLWCWVPQAQREAVVMGWCAGSGGSLGLLGAGASSLPAGPDLAVLLSLAHWHEGGKGHLPRGAEVAHSQPRTVGFSHLAGDVSGAGGAGGALAETLWLLKERASVSPSLEQAGTFFAHSNLSTRWVRGLCWGAGCCTGARWEARLVGRVLGMLSAVREPSAPSWRGGSSHWSLPLGICYAGGVCCAVEHRGYHRELSMPGNPREKGTWPGCAHVLQQQHRDTSVP